MSHKRPRAALETDSHAPYAVFGTPLPPEDEARDDGSYLPLWKQEVRDERGRKRLHGAFTGGWSAGYFNTVGSKQGWTPASFVSSRADRRHQGQAPPQQRPEDYMDEEDLADAAEAQKLQVSDAFAGLGSSLTASEARRQPLLGLLRPQGDTMGLQLMRRMGWKDGQGVGPKVRRKARLDLGSEAANAGGESYLFAPENAPLVRLLRKSDQKGLGYQGEGRLGRPGRGGLSASAAADDDDDDDEGEDGDELDGAYAREGPNGGGQDRAQKGTQFGGNMAGTVAGRSLAQLPQRARGGFGLGILNDTGSDDEDEYQMGPKIRYNRVLGGAGDGKKKKRKKEREKEKQPSAVANPSLTNAPRFLPRTARPGSDGSRCQDGRRPLTGFVLAKLSEELAGLLVSQAPPAIPPGWKSAKKPPAAGATAASIPSGYLSTADAARASQHDARSRAAILGEQTLPGKSVFDYMTTAARDRVAAATGKQNLPAAGGQVGESKPASMPTGVWQIPRLDRETAVAALARSSEGAYADDEPKRRRYVHYLEQQAKGDLGQGEKVEGMGEKEVLREMSEFYQCAQLFKPMTGFMASRFTTAKKTQRAAGGAEEEGGGQEARAEPERQDAGQEAAKMGMFGHLTRSVGEFWPTRLLCKRFNVKAPALERAPGGSRRGPAAEKEGEGEEREEEGEEEDEEEAKKEKQREKEVEKRGQLEGEGAEAGRREAIEGAAAEAEVLRAIFGDDDSD